MKKYCLFGAKMLAIAVSCVVCAGAYAQDSWYRFHKGDAIVAQLPGDEVDSVKVEDTYINVYAGSTVSNSFYTGLIDSVTFSDAPALLPRQVTNMKIDASGQTFYWGDVPNEASLTELEYTNANGTKDTVQVENTSSETAITDDIKHGLAYFRIRTVYGDNAASEWMHIYLSYELTLSGPAISHATGTVSAYSPFRNNQRLPEKRPNVYEGDIPVLNAGDMRFFTFPGSWQAYTFKVPGGSPNLTPGAASPFHIYIGDPADGDADFKVVAADAGALGSYRITIDLNEATISATKVGRYISHMDYRDSHRIVWAGDAPASLINMELEYSRTNGEKETMTVTKETNETSLQDGDIKPGFAYFRYRAAWEDEGGAKQHSDWMRFHPDYVLYPIGGAVGGFNYGDSPRNVSIGSSIPNVYDFNLTLSATNADQGNFRLTTSTGWGFPYPHLRPPVDKNSITTAGMSLYTTGTGGTSWPDSNWSVSEAGVWHFHIDLNEWTFSAEKQ
jgi:hypothetical protein